MHPNAMRLRPIIAVLLGATEALLLARLLLRLLAARPDNPFIAAFLRVTAPLIAPFAGIFGNLDTYNDYTGQRIELEALVAMLIYGVLGYLVVWATRLLRHEPKSQ